MDAGLEMGDTSRMPDWDGLRIFLALSRARTLAAAARKLGIAETTVARRLTRLETEMGASLIERGPGGLALTPGGEAVRAAAEEMESAALSAERRALGSDQQLAGRVRVTAPEILGRYFVLPALQAVLARHPGIAIELISTITRLDVTRREADVAIRTVRPTAPGLVARKVARMAVAPYVRRARKRPALPLAVAYTDGVRLPLRNVVEDRVPNGRVALRTNSIATVLEAVRLGWGAGDLPCFVGDSTPELARAFPSEKPGSLDVWLVVHADVQRTSRIRAVVDELVRVFREGAGLLAAGASA
jgi:DNA-binding transcriptional LysR family regulator